MMGESRPHVMADLGRDGRTGGSDGGGRNPRCMPGLREEAGGQPPHSQPADGPRRHEPAGRSRQLVDDHVAFATTSERNGLEYDALSLAVDLVLSVDRVQSAGHYQLDGARLGPKPGHEIGIWLGAAKPRALALTGRVADGWAAPLMSYMPPAAAAEAQTVIDRAARRCR
jgi:alkanesulfonate monooxygenase SsuD/methylene tetrahydromethanopterin reductase-like flavin-dependent oxidoreductase (luciferase family)